MSKKAAEHHEHAARHTRTTPVAEEIPRISRPAELPADSLQIFLGLLLRVRCGLLGVGIRLQLTDGLVQAPNFLSLSDLQPDISALV